MAPADTIDRSTLRVYLRDHLAASVAAIRLLQRLCDAGAVTPLGEQLFEITRDVCAEQDTLRLLLKQVGGGDRGMGVTLAWLGEKLTRLKLGPGKPRDSGLQLFETLEAITLAFYGRQSLWNTLAGLELDRHLGMDIDFRALADRAGRHLEAVERGRREASRRALHVGSSQPLRDSASRPIL